MIAPTTAIDSPQASSLLNSVAALRPVIGARDAQRADRRERRDVHQVAADVHRRGDGERVAAAELLRQARHHRQERRQHHARRAAVDRDQPGRGSAISPVTVRGSRTAPPAPTNRSMPSVFSSSAISTVTPQTMMITPHGIRLIASRSSAQREQHQDHRAGEGAHARR